MSLEAPAGLPTRLDFHSHVAFHTREATWVILGQLEQIAIQLMLKADTCTHCVQCGVTIRR